MLKRLVIVLLGVYLLGRVRGQGDPSGGGRRIAVIGIIHRILLMIGHDEMASGAIFG